VKISTSVRNQSTTSLDLPLSSFEYRSRSRIIWWSLGLGNLPRSRYQRLYAA